MKQKRFFQTIGLVFVIGLTLVLTKSVVAAGPVNWSKAKVAWVVKPDACRYNVLYKTKGATRWEYALRNVPATQGKGVVWREVTINHLQPGKQYEALVEAYNCGSKKSVPVTNIEVLKTVPMN